MKISFDTDARAVYIELNERPVTRTIECSPEVLIDLDDKGNLVGIEILRLVKVVRVHIQKIAKQFNRPDLMKIHPDILEKVYA